jgi:hypothetical protein
MKPWEETWEAQRYVIEMAGDAGRKLGEFIDDNDDPGWPSCDRDRAQLAAQAPAMARLLLELQWISQESDEGYLPPQCMVCEAYQESTEHAPDCELMAVLKKAGVVG